MVENDINNKKIAKPASMTKTCHNMNMWASKWKVTIPHIYQQCFHACGSYSM